ncbi:hypothetical protein AVEN_167975-1, partial [Araneus ventricosus]
DITYTSIRYCERAKSIIQDSELNFPDIQTVDFQIFQPWNIPQFSFINPFSGFDKNKTSPVIYQQLFSFHRYRYSSYRPIFTDGSKAVGHVGCGIIFDADISSFRLHTSFSILTAELVAIFYALQKISLSTQRQFCIYTDSMSSLETLCHPHFQMHPVAMEILGLLQTLQHGGFSILFCWIPSHVGIIGNEQADHSAKTAVSFLHREIPYCDVKKPVASCIFSLWQETWDLQVRNKLYYVKPFIGLWPVLPTRGADVKLTRLRIGHTRVTHKYLLFGERTPMCPTCNVELTVCHILIECSNFNLHRIHFFNSSFLTLSELLGEKHHPNIFNFLKAIRFLTCI